VVISCRASERAINRPVVSYPPPGPVGTTSLIGFSGYVGAAFAIEASKIKPVDTRQRNRHHLPQSGCIISFYFLMVEPL
jgi:hypothetical protein